MELDSQSSSSIAKNTESSSTDYHHQSSDSINDQLNSLPVCETKIDEQVTGNNGVGIRDSAEETKSVLEDGNSGVESRDSVEESKSAADDGINSVKSHPLEESKSVADDGNNSVEIGDSVEELKSVADDGNNGVEIGVSVEEAKSVSGDGKNGVETGNCVEKTITVSEVDNNCVDDGNCEDEKKSVSDDGNNGVDVIDWAEEVKGFSDDDGNNGDWSEIKSGSEIRDEKEENGDEIDKNEETEKESNRRKHKYPIRPDAEDCSFYLRTGTCKFGMNCKFNHPLNQRKFQGVRVKTKEESVDSATQKLKEKDEEQIDCKYFDRPGGCKFGKACKFNHSRKSNPALKLNFMGLPIRLGEKECPFYMRNGSCKYGANCRFNHPDPTTIGVPDALPRYSNGGSLFSPNVSQSAHAPWSPPAAVNENSPYVPLMFSTTQPVPPQPEWNPYQAPVYPPERSIQMPSPYALNRQLYDRPEKMQSNQNEFPERPGQPECSYFVKTGDCKYKSACKFHHPKTVVAHSSSCLLSDSRLPLRPGEIVCNHYNRYGICKYGPACKYDHPINHAPSSDLTVSVPQQ